MKQICFQMIALVGIAKSMYVQAIQEAKKGDFKIADQLIKDGEENYKEGHAAHCQLI